MSAQPKLTLVSPPRSEDPVSIEFMHRDLARSGLTPEDMQAYPISSFRYDGAGSYVIPYNNHQMYRTRHDRTVNKYLQPKNIRDIWWSHIQDLNKFSQGDVLFIIEGEKKAARFLKRWPEVNVVGIGGAWNGTETVDDGTRRLLPNLQRCLRPGMRVIAIFDGDIQTKPGIQQAATSLRHLLIAHTCELEIFRPPYEKGVDDWLEADPSAAFKDLVPILFDKLAESRKQLYRTLNCNLDDDKLVLNELNAKRILAHYFADSVYTDKRLGVIKDGAITDLDGLESACIEYMQGEINYRYKVPQIRQGLHMALGTKRDLVQEKLLSLQWDGIPRLDTWGSKHFETSFPAFADDWGRILMTGLGLRILRPGTKVDHACILIGAQGIGKSTFFEDLSRFEGQQFYYAATELSSNGGDNNRTQGQMFAKALIVDLAEGVIFETKKAAMDRAKQLITQTHDEYRVAYAKAPTIEERGFIFVGTTNRLDQLGDQTGSRRFLNLETTKITRLPYNDKLQILAEVRAREQEFRTTAWFELRVTVEQAPQQLREEHSHISNVQELVNAQYHRADVRGDMVRDLIDSGELAYLRDSKHFYITAGYLAARLGEDSAQSKSLCARTLSALSSSPSFAYKLENQRKRLSQLVMTENQSYGYTAGINNTQQMINGYIITRK